MSSRALRFDVFGRIITVERSEGEWCLWTATSGSGLRARIHDIVIPAEITQTELAAYFDDLMHEHASERHPRVEPLD